MLAAITLLAQTVIPIPPVSLNHFYLTVDPTTFRAIQKSRWLKENFGEVTISTHSSGKDTWTGLYVYGVGSYVELFCADKRNREGKAGLAFLTAAPGGADNVDHHFRRGHFGGRTSRELMDLGSPEQQAPFAHIVSYGGQETTNLEVWLMEYHAEYYRQAGVPVGSSEAAIFAGWRSKQGKPYKGMLGDLRGVTLQPAGDRKDLGEALRLLGYRGTNEGIDWSRGSNEVTVMPRFPWSSGYGLTSARFSLRIKPKHVHVERFGPRSELRLSPDGTAEWRFGLRTRLPR